MHQRVLILPLNSLFGVIRNVVCRLLVSLALNLKTVFALHTRLILAVRLLSEALRLLPNWLVGRRKVEIALLVLRNDQIFVKRSLVF